jgi:hypothetical protein
MIGKVAAPDSDGNMLSADFGVSGHQTKRGSPW